MPDRARVWARDARRTRSRSSSVKPDLSSKRSAGTMARPALAAASGRGAPGAAARAAATRARRACRQEARTLCPWDSRLACSRSPRAKVRKKTPSRRRRKAKSVVPGLAKPLVGRSRPVTARTSPGTGSKAGWSMVTASRPGRGTSRHSPPVRRTPSSKTACRLPGRGSTSATRPVAVTGWALARQSGVASGGVGMARDPAPKPRAKARRKAAGRGLPARGRGNKSSRSKAHSAGRKKATAKMPAA